MKKLFAMGLVMASMSVFGCWVYTWTGWTEVIKSDIRVSGIAPAPAVHGGRWYNEVVTVIPATITIKPAPILGEPIDRVELYYDDGVSINLQLVAKFDHPPPPGQHAPIFGRYIVNRSYNPEGKVWYFMIREFSGMYYRERYFVVRNVLQ